MTSLSCLENDLPRIISDAKWLIDEGFNYSVESEYILKFEKNEISIEIYYGRYSDPTDVLVKVNSVDSDRYENGDLCQYSVFEAALVDKNIANLPRSDGYASAKAGLNLLKQHKLLFDVYYLRKIHKEYEQVISDNLPEHLRNLLKQ